MKNLIKISSIVVGLSVLAGCSVQTSDRVDLEADMLLYIQDSRTGLCYAAVATRKSFNASTSGLGLANVPCTDKVLKLVGKND